MAMEGAEKEASAQANEEQTMAEVSRAGSHGRTSLAESHHGHQRASWEGGHHGRQRVCDTQRLESLHANRIWATNADPNNRRARQWTHHRPR